jgi:hypothetical protein
MQRRKRSCLFSSIKYHKLLSRFPLLVKNEFHVGKSLCGDFYCLFFYYYYCMNICIENNESFHNDKNYFSHPTPQFLSFKRRLQFFFLASHFSRLFLFFFVFFIVIVIIIILPFSSVVYLEVSLFHSFLILKKQTLQFLFSCHS